MASYIPHFINSCFWAFYFFIPSLPFLAFYFCFRFCFTFTFCFYFYFFNPFWALCGLWLGSAAPAAWRRRQVEWSARIAQLFGLAFFCFLFLFLYFLFSGLSYSLFSLQTWPFFCVACGLASLCQGGARCGKERKDRSALFDCLVSQVGGSGETHGSSGVVKRAGKTCLLYHRRGLAARRTG